MKILVVGTGGVGGYFGGKLAQSGNDVCFVARGNHLQAIKNKGLQIKSINGDFVVFPSKITDKITDVISPELVILAVKAWQIKGVAKELKHIISKETVIIPLQNGVMAVEELSEVISLNQIVGGLCRIFSKIEAPGIIRHFGVEPMIVFGEMNNKISMRVETIRMVFEKSGITSKISADIQTELWKKFILICAGGVLALSKTNYGEVRVVPETKSMVNELLQEIFVLSKKAGAYVESDFVEKSMQYIDTYPFDSTTSMARDIWEGRPSELDYQNGAVIKLGERYGISTPINRFVYSCLLPMELKARKILKVQ